jgi:MFS family permease
VTFRAVQGAGGALLYPAALGIVVRTFPLRQRGRALALFFGAAGALTAVGPVIGGYLVEWTWRAIFWVNIPVGLAAVALIAVSRPETEYRPAPVDYRTVRSYAASLGIAVLGTILVTMLRSDVTSSLTAMGVPARQAAARAARIAQSQGGSSTMAAIPRFVHVDFAHASQTVFLVMAASWLPPHSSPAPGCAPDGRKSRARLAPYPPRRRCTKRRRPGRDQR